MLSPLPQSRSRKAKPLRHSDCSSSLPLKTLATDTHFKAASLPRPPDMLLFPHRGSQGTDIFLVLEVKNLYAKNFCNDPYAENIFGFIFGDRMIPNLLYP